MIGIDEVGRGAWAGPLTVVGVALDEHSPISGLMDSKRLTKARRQSLLSAIQQRSTDISIYWVSSSQIDEFGLRRAMQIAVEHIFSSLSYLNTTTIIDGNINYLPEEESITAVTKADVDYPAVSAASIVAKIFRDSYMARMDLIYPEYDFNRHVGYGTALHLERLKLNGPSKLHRQSFKPIKKISRQFNSNRATS